MRPSLPETLHRLASRPLTWTLLCGAAWCGARGVQGLSPASFEALKRARAASQSPSWSIEALSALLESAHAHLDLLFGIWLKLFAFGDDALSLALMTWSMTLLAMRSLYRVVYRLSEGDELASSVAALSLVALPEIAGQLGAGASPTMITAALWLMTWDGCTIPSSGSRRRRLLGFVGAWFSGALWLGAWSPMLFWSCLLLLAHLLQGAERPDERAVVIEASASGGLIRSARSPIALWLCVPMVPLLATMLHPGLWADAQGGWLKILAAGWLDPSADAGLSVGGRWYEGGKLAPWAPLELIAGATPLSSLLLAIPAALWLRAGRGDGVSRRLLTLSLLAMPWILWATPAASYGQIDQVALALTLLCAALGCGIAWLNQVARARHWPAVAPYLFAASALLSPLSATIAYWEDPHAWRSALVGGAEVTARGGDSISPHAVVPRSALTQALATHGVDTLYGGALTPLIAADRPLPSTLLVDELTGPTAALTEAPRFASDSPLRPQLDMHDKRPIYLGRSGLASYVLWVPKSAADEP